MQAYTFIHRLLFRLPIFLSIDTKDLSEVHGSSVWLFLAKLLITKGHERSLLTLTNCYLYKIRGDASGSEEKYYFSSDPNIRAKQQF